MAARKKSKKTGVKAGYTTRRLFFAVFSVTVISAAFMAVVFAFVFTQLIDRAASRKEYSSLREIEEAAGDEDIRHIPYISAFDAEMREINPDYLCWLKIDGTQIDYPVVRGSDNEKYLNVSLSGEENVYGAIFMDYRCKGEYVPHIIIYGHNTKTGDMFGTLRKFLDAEYLAEHPVITLKTNDRAAEYEIFSARKTDISDPAYNLRFNTAESFASFAQKCGASPDASQIVTLSTCVSEGNDDERVVVQAAMR